MPTDNDGSITDDRAREVMRMLSHGLRQARATRRWSRPQLVARLRTPIPVNTYAGYEQGLRVCSLPRLVEICEALNIAVMVNGAGIQLVPATQNDPLRAYCVAVQRDGNDMEVTVRFTLADDTHGGQHEAQTPGAAPDVGSP